MSMKTYSAKPTDVTRSWHHLDASEVTLGRLATVVAELLMGKRKPQYTAHIDCGDFVVITNAEQLQVTGNKRLEKVYYRHSGHAGGISSNSLQEVIERDATKAVINAVYGMLPANKLRSERMKRLKVFNGSEHAHEAQKPVSISLKKGKK